MVDLRRWSIYGVRVSLWAILNDRNKAINIGEWFICGDGQLERFYCTLDIDALQVVSSGELRLYESSEKRIY